jgi:hypothetical protein
MMLSKKRKYKPKRFKEIQIFYKFGNAGFGGNCVFFALVGLMVQKGGWNFYLWGGMVIEGIILHHVFFMITVVFMVCEWPMFF